MIHYLTVQQVLFLHMRLIDETGGTQGVRDLGLLQAAVARPQATFDGEELYPHLFSKAAAMYHSLVSSHPMADGNKRVGVAAAGLFLERNGYRMTADSAELEAFTLSVAQGMRTVVEIAAWLKAHCASGAG